MPRLCRERWLFDVQPDDRVYQGFSLAFDASVEEVWLALSPRGRRWSPPHAMAHAGPALSELLSQNGVISLVRSHAAGDAER
jgi:non-ribosomal peptide synthetase component F